MSDDTTKPQPGTIRVDEEQLQGHVDQAMRTIVEETLNTMLEAEADQLCRAQRYERSPERADTRAGHGVGARMRAGLRASNRRARHLPMRYETGLPSSVIRFRT